MPFPHYMPGPRPPIPLPIWFAFVPLILWSDGFAAASYRIFVGARPSCIHSPLNPTYEMRVTSSSPSPKLSGKKSVSRRTALNRARRCSLKSAPHEPGEGEDNTYHRQLLYLSCATQLKLLRPPGLLGHAKIHIIPVDNHLQRLGRRLRIRGAQQDGMQFDLPRKPRKVSLLHTSHHLPYKLERHTAR